MVREATSPQQIQPIPYGTSIQITPPISETEQEATPRLGGQRQSARVVFQECLTKALGGLRDGDIIHPRVQTVHV